MEDTARGDTYTRFYYDRRGHSAGKLKLHHHQGGRKVPGGGDGAQSSRMRIKARRVGLEVLGLSLKCDLVC